MSQRSSGSLASSSEALIPPKKGSKSYVRRSRHRTKEDRYKPKQTKGSRKKLKPNDRDAPKRKTKRGRNEKSGTALMHEFSAKNVANDRLTVRLAPRGLYGCFLPPN